jgi:hypothetical protein
VCRYICVVRYNDANIKVLKKFNIYVCVCVCVYGKMLASHTRTEREREREKFITL